MNTKEIFRAIGFGLTIIVAAILFTGCLDPAGYNTGLTYQDYPGPSLPREQVAFLKLDKDMTWNPIAYSGIGVCEIDGKKVHYKFGDTIQLLPGEHTMTFYYSTPLSNALSADPISKSVVVQAGKKYRGRTRSEMKQTSSWSTGGNAYSGHWWVEIKEEQ